MADLEANRHLGSPMDAVLQVVSADGFVLAQNDDAVGRDPRIVFEAPADGDLPRPRSSPSPRRPTAAIRFAGGEAFVYRLTLTTGGFLDHAFPLAVSDGGAGPGRGVGWNIPEARPVDHARGRTRRGRSHADRLRTRCSATRPRSAWSPARRPRVRAERRRRPQPVAPPVAVSGRIDPPRDVDAFAFPAKKGEALRLKVESRAIGQPLDAVVRVMDASGKVVAEADDSNRKRDPELRFTPPPTARIASSSTT